MRKPLQVSLASTTKAGVDAHTSQRQPVERNNFKCPRCHKAHHPENSPLLLCDNCPRSYHLICLDLTFEELPEDEWHCPKCQDRKSGTGKRTPASQAQADTRWPSCWRPYNRISLSQFSWGNRYDKPFCPAERLTRVSISMRHGRVELSHYGEGAPRAALQI